MTTTPATHTTAPPDVMRVLRYGGTAALACAAASSAVSLYGLAILVGWPASLAWLLPASLDVYAGVSLYVGYRLDAAHPATISARRNARFALALSVACNGVYHALVLFGTACPSWAHDALLVTVSALPPLIVERVLHLRSKINMSDEPLNDIPVPVTIPERSPNAGSSHPIVTPLADRHGRDDDRHTPERSSSTDVTIVPPQRTPIVTLPDRSDPPVTPVVTPVNAGVSIDTWIQIARPLYKKIRDGKLATDPDAAQSRPTVPELRTALNNRIDHLIATGELPDTAGGMSISNVKKIRLELENRFPDLTPTVVTA